MKSAEAWYICRPYLEDTQAMAEWIRRIQADAREGMVDAEEAGKAREEALRDAYDACEEHYFSYDAQKAIRALREKEGEGD